jgi:hypothetical protein
MKKLVIMCTLLLAIGGVANAVWISGTTGNWGNSANWSEAVVPGVPTSTSTATINNGTCTLDVSPQVGIVIMGNGLATDVAVLNINTGSNLTAYKATSGELMCLVKGTAAGASGTVNHSAGTVRVYNDAGNGEVRLVTGSTVTAGVANYNLSGTAVLDTNILSKGNAAVTTANFNATGGTLVIRNMIYKFGLISAGLGFNQGQAKLEVGAVGTVGAINVGNSSNAMDYTVGAGGTLAFDIASAASFDKITQYGSLANTLGATLNVNLLGGFTPTAGDTFDVWTFSDKTKAGSGTFASLPSNFTAAWVDTDGLGSLDTLRLTYVPEPATMLLLGLGALVLRRRS